MAAARLATLRADLLRDLERIARAQNPAARRLDGKMLGRSLDAVAEAAVARGSRRIHSVSLCDDPDVLLSYLCVTGSMIVGTAPVPASDPGERLIRAAMSQGGLFDDA